MSVLVQSHPIMAKGNFRRSCVVTKVYAPSLAIGKRYYFREMNNFLGKGGKLQVIHIRQILQSETLTGYLLTCNRVYSAQSLSPQNGLM